MSCYNKIKNHENFGEIILINIMNRPRNLGTDNNFSGSVTKKRNHMGGIWEVQSVSMARKPVL